MINIVYATKQWMNEFNDDVSYLSIATYSIPFVKQVLHGYNLCITLYPHSQAQSQAFALNVKNVSSGWVLWLFLQHIERLH